MISCHKPNPSLKAEYDNLDSFVNIIRAPAELLLIEGKDTLEFFHNLSTNDIKGLQPNRYRTTVITTEKGRIVDIVRLIQLNKKFLLLVSLGAADHLKQWLEKFIIMEDVTITKTTNEFSIYYFIIPKVVWSTDNFSFFDRMEMDGTIHYSLNQGNEHIFFRDQFWSIPVFFYLTKETSNQVIESGVENIFPKRIDARAISIDLFEILRIENGVPYFQKEFNDHFNPLEVNLENFVSFTKGCYVGQEVIARLDTYDKVQRRLKGFVFQDGIESYDGDGKLVFDNLEVGWISSCAWSYKLKRVIALGYLKSGVKAKLLELKDETMDNHVLVTPVRPPFW